ncbi:MAG: 3-hydroxyacyl-ACP dehydratase FabZ [bacterium]|nr:3-hydroxyacyl-ACP dehydratase FabZ [bacterium]
MDWIKSVLPHRYPFLLVDKVLELESGERARAVKNVTVNEPFFVGHFPGQPVMPGVLVIEALAQAAGILLIHDRSDRAEHLIYLAGVDDAKFRRPVRPGDQLILDVEIIRARPSFAKVHGVARVDGQVAAEAMLTSAMVPS